MKRMLSIVSALLLSMPPMWAQAAHGHLSVTGVVINGVDANPLPLCIVKFLQSGECKASGISDCAGEYSLPGLPPGSYDILVTQFGDTLMHYKGLTLSRDTWVRSVVMPPGDNGRDDWLPQRVAGMVNLPMVRVTAQRNLLARMGLLITSPDDSRLWNFSGRMDGDHSANRSGDFEFGTALCHPGFEVHPLGSAMKNELILYGRILDVYHPASDSSSIDYRFWILGFKL